MVAATPRKRANSEEKKLSENDESFELEFIQDDEDFALYVYSDPKFYFEKGKLVAEIV